MKKNKQEKNEMWQVVSEQYHDCPDCMALVKIVVEKEFSTGAFRSKLIFVEHRV